MEEQEITYDMWIEFKKDPSIEMRNHILISYLGLVKNIAWRLVPTYKNHFEFDDLYSSGIFGLMDAIEKYDVDKNIKFETYASLRIRGAIIDQIRKQDWIPRSFRQKVKMVEDAHNTLENNNGKSPSEKEIARFLGISVSEVEKIISESYTYQIISMDEQIMDIMNKDEFISIESSPEQDYEEKELKDELSKVIDKLTKNERMVVSLYYFDELNQKEISNVMSLSESRVSQLHSRALIKIMNAARQLNVNSNSAAKSMEKLSSGYRINRAGDDAAGLAISEKMRGQIRGLNQASKNSQEGISLIQTAEAALNETHSVLQRMRELAVQAATGTLENADREQIDKEFQALKAEVGDIATTTQFNKMKLLDGEFKDISLQTGANMDETLEISIEDMSATGLAIDGLKTELAGDASTAIDELEKAIKLVSDERAKLGANQNRLEYKRACEEKSVKKEPSVIK